MNLHTHVLTASREKTIRAIPGTEVVGELPRLVVMGDSSLLAKEAGDRGWTVNYLGEIIGHEADNIIVVGPIPVTRVSMVGG